MQRYIGTKVLDAEPMTLGDYNRYRGWSMPSDEDPTTPGYYLVYPDDYVSWSPAPQFEEAYRLTSGMPFGLAVEAMRKGEKVGRVGWNGKNMFIFLVSGSTFKVNRPPLNVIYPDGTEIRYHAHVDMRTADGMIVPWLCSQTDMLADDWEIIV